MEIFVPPWKCIRLRVKSITLVIPLTGLWKVPLNGPMALTLNLKR